MNFFNIVGQSFCYNSEWKRNLTTRLSRNNTQRFSNVSYLANILINNPISGWVVIGLEPKVRLRHSDDLTFNLHTEITL